MRPSRQRSVSPLIPNTLTDRSECGDRRRRVSAGAVLQAQPLVAAEATHTGPGVTVDGRLVTANGPKSSSAFGQRIVELLDTPEHTRILSACPALHGGVD